MSDVNNEYMRTFVCVSPDAVCVAALSTYMSELRACAGYEDYKWVAPENAHITLRFLGETEPAAAQKMDSNLARLGGIRPFEIRVAGAGGFPDLAFPRAIWLGVRVGAPALEKLALKVEQAAKSAGFPPEKRRFKAHLTLARARAGARLTADLAEALTRAPELVWRMDSFSLTKSELTPKGPVYTALRRYGV